ncbi:allantoinase PuuE [Roseibium sp. RKSG952]|uniref:allantoinase PuuE n=1 Tax=Roseibium sp. RKSG952 TaxID=2529384 RepID=UPI0012BC190C|nr:allantoinase PuuE [Roseibium sp. RKSG952]MTH95846.1 allantoinase PuuE [Roseibium sp. RKSG952]
MQRYPRDMRGYGPNPPDPKWPGGARIAVQFVLNYEEGGENCILHGDAASEMYLSDAPTMTEWPGRRNVNMESLYEYGPRAGFWRLYRLFTQSGIPVTIFGVTTALARGPEQVEAMKEAGWEIASHGLKWIEHKDLSLEDERAAIAEAIRLHKEVVGEPPRGWYTGRGTENSNRLVVEADVVEYISDAYNDDLPYWADINGKQQLIVPYTLEANDFRFAMTPGWTSGEDFLAYLKNTFDYLYAEGQAGRPKMMSVGLHFRLTGRPGKIAALQKFIAYIQSKEAVWCPRRIEIAQHWKRHHPPDIFSRPSQMSKTDFVAAFGDVFQNAPWVAERAYGLELGPAHDCSSGLYNALCRSFRAASHDKKRDVLEAVSQAGQNFSDDFETACREIERLAWHRLQGRLP